MIIIVVLYTFKYLYERFNCHKYAFTTIGVYKQKPKYIKLNTKYLYYVKIYKIQISIFKSE